MPKYRYLFNFASSCSGGGLRILLSYLTFFEKNGGAYFIINSKLKNTVQNFSNNRIDFVELSNFKRLINDTYYVTPIIKEIGNMELYFSYGIPFRKKFAPINWLHISNMIPISPSFRHLSFLRMCQMYLLGYRLKKTGPLIDCLSADSKHALKESLKFLSNNIANHIVLKNGIDEKLLSQKSVNSKEKCAITIGTLGYKDLNRLHKVFNHLKRMQKVKALKIIGDTSTIPNCLKSDPDVILLGTMPYEEVLNHLGSSSIYISTSLIENSSIACLEGLLMCEESYLSQIGPHKEMLEDAKIAFESINLDDVGFIFKVTEKISSDYVKNVTWDNLNTNLIDEIKKITASNQSNT